MTLTYRELSVNLLSISNSEISLGKDSHNERVAVPWREIGLNPKKFIHPKYIPDNVAIQDPSHMQSTISGRFVLKFSGAKAEGSKHSNFRPCFQTTVEKAPPKKNGKI